jgi:hypothetical protein
MAATADPRAKAPATQPPHHLKPWAPSPPPRAHSLPSLPAVSGPAGADRDRRRSSTSHRPGGADAAVHEEPYDARLEDLQNKLMGRLHHAADRLKLPPAKPRRSPEPNPPSPPQDAAAAAAAASSMPWTLRERRRRPSARAGSPATPWYSTAVSATATARDDDGARAPFAVALEAEEIEEDVYALTGARPRRRPRKRPRTVQRQLDVRPTNSPYCPSSR